MEKDSIGRLGTDDNIIRHMRVACWIIKATNTHSKPVIPLDFSQQNFYEQAYRCCTYTNDLVRSRRKLLMRLRRKGPIAKNLKMNLPVIGMVTRLCIR